jgi:hypothetical protein
MVFAIAQNANGVCNRPERQWCLQSPRTPMVFAIAQNAEGVY